MASQKEKAWLEFYLGAPNPETGAPDGLFNATEAARLANYKWPNKIGPTKVEKFSEEIERRLDAMAMSADEVLLRLTEQGRVSMGDFVRIKPNGTWEWDLAKAKRAGKLHLIKKLKHRETEHGAHMDVELESRQKALELLGKQHGIFKEQHEHEVRHNFPDFDRALDKAYGSGTDDAGTTDQDDGA